MAIFKTESEREVQVLDHLGKQIERREKIHRFLLLGLTGLLAMSLAVHAASRFARKRR